MSRTRTTPASTRISQGTQLKCEMHSLIRTMGAASAVLLKNSGNVLPLRAPRTMAVVGSGARPAIVGPNQ